ncbi:MAG TPA: amino acid permease [Mucilaginibacter sp.]|jgi:APA family basic amino acid/polyamine antiporter
MQKLSPTLNLRSSIFIVIGIVIGSGVFKKVAVMSATLKSPGLVLLCWGLAGVISLTGALCSSELACMFANSGGEYFYFQKVYNRFFAFLWGWANFVVVQTAGMAALAYIFAESFNSVIPLPTPSVSTGNPIYFLVNNFSVKLIATLLILFLSYANYRGVKHAEKLNRFMTFALLAAAVAIIISGLSSHTGNIHNLTTPASNSGNGLGGWPLIKSITIASLGAFWGYEGWNGIGMIGEEIKSPKRNIPLSLAFGMLTIISIYILLNLVYLYILPIDTLIKINDHPNQIAAQEVMKVIWGKWGALFIAVLIMVTTFNATNGTILTSARVYYAMARDNNFYRHAATVHPTYKTPSVSILLQGIWSVLLIWSGTFDQLTDMTIFSAFIFYGATAIGVMVMRKRDPLYPRPYKVIGYPFTPVIFCMCCLTLISITLYNQPKEALSGLGLIALGIPFYWFWTKRKPVQNEAIIAVDQAISTQLASPQPLSNGEGLKN